MKHNVNLDLYTTTANALRMAILYEDKCTKLVLLGQNLQTVELHT